MNIADSGLIIAFLDPRDQHHPWAAQVFPEGLPYRVCEPVLTEVMFQLEGHRSLFALLARGALRLDWSLTRPHLGRVQDLMDKYQDRPMSLADACCVAMCDERGETVFTVDRVDFMVYRRAQGLAVPARFPTP